METRRALLVDAFTTDPLAGNPAGVVPDADGLADDQLQAIAAELGASETAFVLESDDADHRLRFFTPTTEVDLCGHATVAAHAWLAETGRLDDGSYTVETDAGAVAVEIDSGTVWLSQRPAEVEAVELDYERLATALSADPATLTDVGADMPLATASTGLPYLVVPVNFLEGLSALDPNADAVASLSDELDVAGVYAFTFDTLGAETTLHARMFAPALGVDEDPVTGTAAAAVGAYLRAFDAFDGELPAEVVVEQGHFIDRPGKIRVQAQADPVTVGGEAATAFDGELSVPESGDDDIIEA